MRSLNNYLFISKKLSIDIMGYLIFSMLCFGAVIWIFVHLLQSIKDSLDEIRKELSSINVILDADLNSGLKSIKEANSYLSDISSRMEIADKFDLP
jgi:hypothetical protein